MNFTKLLKSCRIVTVAPIAIKTRTIEDFSSKYLARRQFQCATMSQRSITSFFKVTPPKIDTVKEKNTEREVNGDKSPFANGKDKKSSKKQRVESSDSESEISIPKRESLKVESEKRTSKRQRVESSESETELSKEKPKVESEKKIKPKRQRIESSGSESEPTKSPKSDNKPSIKTERSISPNSSKENQDNTNSDSLPDIKPVKVEKSDPPKTYDSPKSRKRKSTAEKKEPKKKDSPKQAASKKDSSNKIGSKKDDSNKIGSKKDDSNKIGSKKDSSNKTSSKDTTEEDSSKKSVSPESSPESKEVKKAVNGSDNSPKQNKGNEKEKDEKDAVEKVAEADYNPAKSKYHPIKDACWSAGQPVPYLALARTLEAIEGTSARLKMIEILSNYLRSVIVLTPEDLLPSVYMCLNQLAPAYHGLELGIAETYLMKAVGQCTGRTLAQVKAAAQKAGDLGAAAAAARATQRTMFAPPPLKARQVFNALREIANMTGQASVNKKINKIQTLFVACRHSEAKYLIRSLEGKLRIGLAEQSALQALALATATTPPGPAGVTTLDASKGVPPDKFKAKVDENALIIKTTYCECPNYDNIIPVLLKHGVAALPEHCRLTVGVPLKPMLAHPTKGVHEVFNRFEGCQFTCEWKYDGERAQIHVPAAGTDGPPDLGKASIFSRNQENNTSKYPDILRRLPTLLKAGVRSCVLDCEAVAYDTINKQILPFQILSTRKRKDAAEGDIKVQVCVFVFDLLLLNGAPLVREPLERRRALLREHFNEVEGEWQFATSADCSTMEEVQQFLEESVKGSCEGLMVKTLTGDQAKYDIARRSRNWLKLKKDYLEGVGDTIDVVIIGAYSGRGKRKDTFGGFLAAVRDPETDTYQAICKLGTGFSDEDLQTLSAQLNEHVIDAPRSYYNYDNSHSPDAWFGAACVWEVRCADLSLSPAHRAAIGLVDPDKGISLRFPRFVRVRDDKTPEQATCAQQIAEMYLSQDQVKNQTNKPAVNYDDFY